MGTSAEEEEPEMEEEEFLKNINIVDVEEEEKIVGSKKGKEPARKAEVKSNKDETVIQQPLKKRKTELVVSWLLLYLL